MYGNEALNAGAPYVIGIRSEKTTILAALSTCLHIWASTDKGVTQ